VSLSDVEDAITHEVWIDASLERVWSLVTQPEPLGRWFADAGAAIDLRPGGALELRWSHGAVVRGRVEAIEPRRRLVFRWAPFRTPEGREPRSGNSTVVEITLASEWSGTRVQVVERGFAALDCADVERAANREDNAEGWKLELGDLQALAIAAAE